MTSNSRLTGWLLSAMLAALFLAPSSAFSSLQTLRADAAFVTRLFMSTTTAPPPPKTDRRTSTETDRRTRTGGGTDFDDIVRYNDSPLEYLEDEWSTRDPEDPFHILLMGSTFSKSRITVSYVAGSLSYVLSMPEEEGVNHASFAKEEGMSCLGTWKREECLELGRQLQLRDLQCRVVPFCEGGGRGWQARDASGAGASSGGAEFGGFQ
uniref:Uncharacterized protein n=1 Tax=Odontella aurita TaxID=265563 RepID=A0A7S4J4Z4_9STRA|mmetsp:Transcript_38637/g.116002  ORF Transcript_38637/g.116002 Transcript_38637/m.116002 type:complete len:209 (+) Transcript_38637:314-940(+)